MASLNSEFIPSNEPLRGIGLGAMEATKPYGFIGLGVMEDTEPYEFIGGYVLESSLKGVREVLGGSWGGPSGRPPT